MNIKKAGEAKNKKIFMHIDYTKEDAESQIIEFRPQCQPPTVFTLKINTGLHYNETLHYYGIGIILHDFTGTCTKARSFENL